MKDKLIQLKNYLNQMFYTYDNVKLNVLLELKQYNDNIFSEYMPYLENFKYSYKLSFEYLFYRLLSWIYSLEGFKIRNINNSSIELISEKFDLIATIELQLNITGAIDIFPKNQFLFELHYICSVKEGLGVGKKFIKQFLEFYNNEPNIPLVLYCEKDLLTYYQKLGFKEQYKNNKNEYLMLYFDFN